MSAIAVQRMPASETPGGARSRGLAGTRHLQRSSEDEGQGSMSGKNFDLSGCLAALFVLMVLLGCLFWTTEKLFGSAGEPVGYAVLALLGFALVRYIWKSVSK
jgi:F0F1-type ATP synthase assembly protein I